MANLANQQVPVTLKVEELTRIRSWALFAREELGGGLPGWTEKDVQLLDFLETSLLEANEVNESIDA